MPARNSSTQDKSCSYRGVDYRLVVESRANARKLLGIIGACRFVWNNILNQCQESYQQAKEAGEKTPSVSFFTLGKAFTKLRTSTPWLQDYSFTLVRYSLKGQADAWKKFFHGTAQPPKFKAKYRSKQSFTIAENVKINDGKILVPKVGWLRLRRKGGNPYPDGVPVQATIKKVGKQWRVSVLYKITTPETNQNGVIIGVDLNTYNVAWTDSKGERGMLEIEKPSIKEIRIRRYQRKLARQQKGSNRSKETKRRIARLNQKQATTRKNRAHHTSRALANRAQVLVREDLNITGMSSSARGTIEMPGKNVRAKSGLNRVILNASWARFNTYCDYKFTEVVTVDPKYTSQRCNQCGRVDKRNRLSQSKFVCVLWTHRSCRRQRVCQCTGLRDWGNWTTRGVSIRNLYDPSNGYGNVLWALTYIIPNNIDTPKQESTTDCSKSCIDELMNQPCANPSYGSITVREAVLRLRK